MEEVTTTKSLTDSSERRSKPKGKPPFGPVISANFSSFDFRSKRQNGKQVATPNTAADTAIQVSVNAEKRNQPNSDTVDDGKCQQGEAEKKSSEEASSGSEVVGADKNGAGVGAGMNAAERSFVQAILGSRHQVSGRVRDPLGDGASPEGKSYRLIAFEKGKVAAARQARAALHRAIANVCGREVSIAASVLASPNSFMEWLQQEVAQLLTSDWLKFSMVAIHGCSERRSN